METKSIEGETKQRKQQQQYKWDITFTAYRQSPQCHPAQK